MYVLTYGLGVRKQSLIRRVTEWSVFGEEKSKNKHARETKRNDDKRSEERQTTTTQSKQRIERKRRDSLQCVEENNNNLTTEYATVQAQERFIANKKKGVE